MSNNEGKLVSSLFKKISAILEDGLHVEKSGYNSFHKYQYVTEADVVAAARKAFVKHKLIYHYTMEEVLQVADSPGMCRAKVKFTLIDAETGDMMHSIVYGDGQDKGDKGPYKALTGAQKYFLLKTFLIATGDDPEADVETDKAAAAPTATPSSWRKPKPAAVANGGANAGVADNDY